MKHKKTIDLSKFKEEKVTPIENPLPLPGTTRRPNEGSVFPRSLQSLQSMAEAKADPRMLFGGLQDTELYAAMFMASMMGAAVTMTKGFILDENRIDLMLKEAVNTGEKLATLLKERSLKNG